MSLSSINEVELGLLLKDVFEQSTKSPASENYLSGIKAHPEALQFAQHLLSYSSDQYVLWFAISIIEEKLQKKWESTNISDRISLTNIILQLVTQKQKWLPIFVRNKLVKLYVNIGKRDWPHNYPDLLNNIHLLIKNAETCGLGLYMLRVVCEEFVTSTAALTTYITNDNDILVERKTQLTKLLAHQLPPLLDTVMQLLFELHDIIMHTSGHSPENAKAKPSVRESVSLAKTAFETLSLMFNWLPLETINHSLVDICINYLSVIMSRTSVNQQSDRAENEEGTRTELCAVALSCVNELLSRNYVPKQFQSFFVNIFKQLLCLLQAINASVVSGSVQRHLNPQFLDQLSEFLVVFVAQHIGRVSGDESFPMEMFLSELFTYTFLQSDTQSYVTCLQIWTAFIEWLLSQRSSPHPVSFEKYQTGFTQLFQELLKKVQFSSNSKQLETLDKSQKQTLISSTAESESSNPELELESASEYEIFFKESIELIAKIAELQPDVLLQKMYEILTGSVDRLFGKLDHVLNYLKGSTSVILESNNNELFWVVTDTSTYLRICCRLSEHFIVTSLGSNYSRFSTALGYVHKILQLLSYLQSNQMHKMGKIFVDLLDQVISTLISEIDWLSIFGQEAISRVTTTHAHSQLPASASSQYHAILSILLDQLLVLFDPNSSLPQQICLSISRLFRLLITRGRPPSILSYQQLEYLLQNYTLIYQYPFHQVQIEVIVGVSNAILLPFRDTPEQQQQWEARKIKFQQFITPLLSHLYQLHQSASISQSQYQYTSEDSKKFQEIFTILREIVFATPDSKSPKHILFQSIQGTLPISIKLIAHTTNDTQLFQILLDYFFAIFSSFRTQIETEVALQLLEALQNVYTGEKLQTIIKSTQTNMKVDAIAVNSICKYLDILSCIAQEPTPAFDSFLAGILTICMEHIYPVIYQDFAATSVGRHFFSILYHLLLHKAKMLYVNPPTPQNIKYFVDIMWAFIRSFAQTDIALFRQNLEALEQLNQKQKLFQRPVFVEHVAFPLLQTLLSTLMSKSHHLLRDDITSSLFHILSVDFESFYTKILPLYLDACGLTAPQKASVMSNFGVPTDMPSFSTKLWNMLNDVSLLIKSPNE